LEATIRKASAVIQEAVDTSLQKYNQVYADYAAAQKNWDELDKSAQDGILAALVLARANLRDAERTQPNDIKQLMADQEAELIAQIDSLYEERGTLLVPKAERAT
jgi:hypothetical protein